MASKRSAEEAFDHDNVLTIQPLGAGQEVGRSCHILKFKGKTIMLDIGIHPGKSGTTSLPFTDLIDLEEIDILLVSHFHLDHCGALPWLLTKTRFKGKVFMTRATKAIYRWMLLDYVKVSNFSVDQMLYTKEDIESSMGKIETINFHQETEINGVRFWAYHAGHVLGAAMFMIDIAGVKILYTGDFSREEDRHLISAEVPPIKPHILITESTYGIHKHDDREKREARFTGTIHQIVNRGGRCLIPVFALGRAQELMLILDEYWASHPELHGIPIYYASSLATKCMDVYRTYINDMNKRVQEQLKHYNPFKFRHISNLKNLSQFDDSGPAVFMASPGMLQNGMSRQLCEMWAPDARNGCLIAGYCVEGTLAKELMNEPPQIRSLSGAMIDRKMTVDYISFSAHTDYAQTSDFVKQLLPTHIVLVHGEFNEMFRLKQALKQEYEDDQTYKIDIHTPENAGIVKFYFRGEKMAKIVGKAANITPSDGVVVSGVLIKKGFTHRIVVPEELPKYTDMKISSVVQRQVVHFPYPFGLLFQVLRQMHGAVVQQSTNNNDDNNNNEISDVITVMKNISIKQHSVPESIVVEWISNFENDLWADSVMAVILQIESSPTAIKLSQSHGHGQRHAIKDEPNTTTNGGDHNHHHHEDEFFDPTTLTEPEFKAKLVKHLGTLYEGSLVDSEGSMSVVSEGKKAIVRVATEEVSSDDAALKTAVSSAIKRYRTTFFPFQ